MPEGLYGRGHHGIELHWDSLSNQSVRLMLDLGTLKAPKMGQPRAVTMEQEISLFCQVSTNSEAPIRESAYTANSGAHQTNYAARVESCINLVLKLTGRDCCKRGAARAMWDANRDIKVAWAIPWGARGQWYCLEVGVVRCHQGGS